MRRRALSLPPTAELALFFLVETSLPELAHSASLFTGDVPKHSLTITLFPARRTLFLVDVHPRPSFIPRLKTTPKVDLCSKSRFKLIYELLL
jgi:hypothetical protein